MLPTQLKAIKSNLQSITAAKKSLTDDQKKLLHELNFIDNSAAIKEEFKNYSYEAMHLESFAIASTNCPSCGKKY